MEDVPIEFQCGTCGKALKVKARGAGKTIKCPGCERPVVVPTPQHAAAAVADDPFGFGALGELGDMPVQPDPLPPVPQPVRNPPTPNMVSAVHAAPQLANDGPVNRLPATQEIALPASRSYPALALIASVCRIMAALVVILSSLGIAATIVITLLMESDPEDSIAGRLLGLAFAVLPGAVGAFLLALLLVTAAEMINLAVHVQGNTLATAHAARRSAG